MGEKWGKMGKKWAKNEITGVEKTVLMHASAQVIRGDRRAQLRRSLLEAPPSVDYRADYRG